MKTKKWFFLLVFSFFGLAILAGCGKSGEDEETSVSKRKIDSALVRPADIDVATIDKNGDGNVYQCPMDWQVISDTTGSCPICMMDLEQYSVADAQKNLKDNPPHNH
jgi:hypothetical protein